MRRFVPPVLTTAATAGIVYWSLVTVTAARSVRWIAPLVFRGVGGFFLVVCQSDRRSA
jgi:hypothetical protein